MNLTVTDQKARKRQPPFSGGTLSPRPHLRQAALFGPRLTACFLLLLAASPLRGDTIVLKNGNLLDGEIISEGPRRVLVKLPYGTLSVTRNQIKEIRRTSALENFLIQGEQLLHHEDFERALIQFREAVRVAPDSSRARRKLTEATAKYAEFLFSVKRYEEAASLFRSALKIDKNNPQAKEALARVERIQQQYPILLKRAESLLHSGKLTQARALFATLWEQYPRRRKRIGKPFAWTEIALGDHAAQRSAFSEARTHYESALTYYPDWFPQILQRYLYAQCKVAERLIAQQKFSQAEKLLGEALTYAPENKVLHFLMGKALEEQGRLQEAIEHYDRLSPQPGLKFDPEAAQHHQKELARREAEGKVSQTEPEGAGASVTIRTPHFVVEAPQRALARRVADSLELHFKKLSAAFGVKDFQRRCEVIVHRTKEAFHRAAATDSWAPATSRWKYRLGHLYQHQIHTYRSCPQLFVSVLPHELTHILTAARLGYRSDVPLWAAEGLAIRSEPPFKHRFYRNALGLAHTQHRLIPLRTLLQSTSYPEEAVDLYYAQGFSLVSYLVGRKGLEHFLRFLAELRGPSDWETFRKFFGFRNASHLQNHWLHAAFPHGARR